MNSLDLAVVLSRLGAWCACAYSLNHLREAPASDRSNVRKWKRESMPAMKATVVLLACLAVSSCGMAKAARQTGQTFDKYGCLARDFKGQPSCDAADSATPKP
ncbi:protein of unknown function [Aminobacter niigataensis]|nr:protein of unknown function [Aminobacter niigataensis]